jgi:hypothetical protein
MPRTEPAPGAVYLRLEVLAGEILLQSKLNSVELYAVETEFHRTSCRACAF